MTLRDGAGLGVGAGVGVGFGVGAVVGMGVGAALAVAAVLGAAVAVVVAWASVGVAEGVRRELPLATKLGVGVPVPALPPVLERAAPAARRATNNATTMAVFCRPDALAHAFRSPWITLPTPRLAQPAVLSTRPPSNTRRVRWAMAERPFGRCPRDRSASASGGAPAIERVQLGPVAVLMIEHVAAFHPDMPTDRGKRPG